MLANTLVLINSLVCVTYLLIAGRWPRTYAIVDGAAPCCLISIHAKTLSFPASRIFQLTAGLPTTSQRVVVLGPFRFRQRAVAE